VFIVNHQYPCASLYLLIAGVMMTSCASVNTSPATTDKSTAPPVTTVAPAIPPEAQQHQAEIAKVTDFKIDGRMGVQSQGYGVSGNIHWVHSPENDLINLYSPLGNKIAAITKNVDGVSLISQNGKTIKAEDAETLTQLTLGWRLPFSKLSDWIVGRPANGVVTTFSWDDKGQLSKFTQDGWEVSYMQYQNDSQPALPSKINLRNPKINVRLVIDSWDTSPQFLVLDAENSAQTH
jgi:outer membrane lipoprotein LolB